MDTSSPNAGAAPTPERRKLLIATGAAAGLATVATGVPFVSSLAPSERAKAMGAPVQVGIADIPPGGMKTVEWRGKPAATKLEVPPHRYLGDGEILIG
jgi:ubiquinol-cytochrome c reductase iron-sulfur subunit